jgi:hypothetical protein
MVTLNHQHCQESRRDDTKHPKLSSSSVVPMALREVLYSAGYQNTVPTALKEQVNTIYLLNNQ